MGLDFEMPEELWGHAGRWKGGFAFRTDTWVYVTFESKAEAEAALRHPGYPVRMVGTQVQPVTVDELAHFRGQHDVRGVGLFDREFRELGRRYFR